MLLLHDKLFQITQCKAFYSIESIRRAVHIIDDFQMFQISGLIVEISWITVAVSAAGMMLIAVVEMQMLIAVVEVEMLIAVVGMEMLLQICVLDAATVTVICSGKKSMGKHLYIS